MRKTIVIAGAAGEGINTVEMYLEKILKQSGYDLYSYKNYMSRIRGGYNYSTITVSDEPVFSADLKGDYFVALNKEALLAAKDQMTSDGVLLASSLLKTQSDLDSEVVFIEDASLKTLSKSKNAFGMAAVGYLLKVFGVVESGLEKIRNKKWSDAVNEENMALAKAGFDLANAVHTSGKVDEKRILLGGNQAVALGALSAGLGFYCAYPMAPSTGIMNYLMVQDKKANIIVEQAEDEIAAAMAAIGAASNGVRSMTGTSGGGFSLMVEALGFAAVSETPVVICNVQRPGPATGLPTRTEQADLAFVVTASQGEFSRIVMAPQTIEDCYYATFRAFNLADKYQVPVMILTDQLLADSVQSVKRFDTQSLEIQRHLLQEPVENYERYAMGNLFGNRKYPGIDESTLIMTDSHVHTPEGYITESEEFAVKLKDKFIQRTEAIKSDLEKPKFYGVDDYDTLMICWGSTYGALKEAVDEINASGAKVAMLSFTDVFPIAEDILDDYVKADTKIINVEANGTNQFGKILKAETGVKYHYSINKYDGRPFTRAFIKDAYEVIAHVK